MGKKTQIKNKCICWTSSTNSFSDPCICLAKDLLSVYAIDMVHTQCSTKVPTVEYNTIFSISYFNDILILNDIFSSFSVLFFCFYIFENVCIQCGEKNDLTPFKESCLCLRGYRGRSCVYGRHFNQMCELPDWLWLVCPWTNHVTCAQCILGHFPHLFPVFGHFWRFPRFSLSSPHSYGWCCWVHTFKNRINTNQLKTITGEVSTTPELQNFRCRQTMACSDAARQRLFSQLIDVSIV